MVSPAVTMKLLIDTKAKRVLYAEGGKVVADIFFRILTTPLSTVAKLLKGDGAQATGIANIFDSAKKMDPTYMRSSAVREVLLNSHRYTLLTHPTILPQPVATMVAASSTFMQATSQPNEPLMSATSMIPGSGLPSSGSASGGKPGGFVQCLVMYIIMDDLTIAPMSNISAMVLLSKLNGEDKGIVLEEKSVEIGWQKVTDIIRASLHSNTVLTDVFLSKNTNDISTSRNKRARTSNDKNNFGEEKNDMIPDYYI